MTARTLVRPKTAAMAAVLLVVSSVLAFSAFVTVAGAQAGHGSNLDTVVGPPAPSTCDGQQWVGVSGQPPDLTEEVRLIYRDVNPVQTYTVPGMTVPAGTVDITEMITWDGYIRPDVDRRDVQQNDEQVRIEFYKDGVMVAASQETPDLTDYVASAWWVGPVGSVTLPDGADEVRLVHSSIYDGIVDNTNSIVPVAFCLDVTPTQEPTTTTAPPTTSTEAPTTTAPATTAAPTTTVAPTTTAAPATTVAPTTTVPTEVGGAVQTTTTVQSGTSGTSGQQLAVTGTSSTTLLIAVGVALIALGLVLRDLRRSLD